MNWKKRLKYIKYIFRKIHKPFHHRLRIFCTDTHNAAVGNTECKPLFVYKRTPQGTFETRHPPICKPSWHNVIFEGTEKMESKIWDVQIRLWYTMCIHIYDGTSCTVFGQQQVGNFDVNSCHWSMANWYNCNLWGAGRSVESNIIKANAVLNILQIHFSVARSVNIFREEITSYWNSDSSFTPLLTSVHLVWSTANVSKL